MKVIITGATGMVGEGVLIECLQNEMVSQVLMVNRKNYALSHPKLKELIVKDFMKIEDYADDLNGFDACFFCAGISSVGMKEADYTRITYDMTLHFANVLERINPQMIFTYVSGSHTDSTEKGRQMWARVKGKTENDLMKLSFRGVYNFRPGFMKPFKQQKNIKPLFKPLIALFPILLPKLSLTMRQVGRAMIHVVSSGYNKQILEIPDIKKLAE